MLFYGLSNIPPDFIKKRTSIPYIIEKNPSLPPFHIISSISLFLKPLPHSLYTLHIQIEYTSLSHNCFCVLFSHTTEFILPKNQSLHIIKAQIHSLDFHSISLDILFCTA